jgi:hypothetical protein
MARFIAPVALITVVPLVVALAQGDADRPATAGEPNVAAPNVAAPNADQPPAEQVLNELLQRRADHPLIEPARPSSAGGPRERSARPVGTAPGVGKGQLKREGQFVVRRRGRMKRATGGAASPWMFTFDADRANLDDPPMYLMPCRMLEDMEQIVRDRGESVAFIISGQVFVYHNANYLLPTLMELAADRGNLQP